MNPRNHVLIIVLTCLLTVLGGTQTLAWWSARAAHENMAEQRNNYLLQSLRTATENYLAIGLNLDQMEALQGLIERERAGFSRVLAIDVFAVSGTVLYSTDPNALGSLAPERWRRSLTDTASWHNDEASQRQFGVRFENDLGNAAGGIVLTVSTAPIALTLAQWQARGQAALQILAALILAGLCTWAGVALALRRLLTPYKRVARILQGQADTTLDKATTAQEQAALHTHSAWSAAQQHARQRMLQLQKLDDA